MRNRIYTDTSVIGGYFDEEFEKYSKKFFNKVEETGSVIMLSNVALDEVADAPQEFKIVQNLSLTRILKKYL